MVGFDIGIRGLAFDWMLDADANAVRLGEKRFEEALKWLVTTLEFRLAELCSDLPPPATLTLTL